MRVLLILLFIVPCFLLFSCDYLTNKNDGVIMKVEVEDIKGLSRLDEAEIDREVYTEGSGSLKIISNSAILLQLANTGDIDIEDSLLVYRANIKTEELEGRVYLEMWCSFKDKGQFFSRTLETALSGTNDWTVLEAPFFLKKGENPDDVKLNIVIEGKGTVWLDEIELSRKPLK